MICRRNRSISGSDRKGKGRKRACFDTGRNRIDCGWFLGRKPSFMVEGKGGEGKVAERRG